MKTLELNQMEVLVGSNCVSETIQGGISGAITGGLFAGPGGIALGWLAGGLGGLIGCAITQNL